MGITDIAEVHAHVGVVELLGLVVVQVLGVSRVRPLDVHRRRVAVRALPDLVVPGLGFRACSGFRVTVYGFEFRVLRFRV